MPARGTGLCLRRRNRVRLVSDHAFIVAGGGVPEILRAVCASTQRPGRKQVCDRAGPKTKLASIGVVIGANWKWRPGFYDKRPAPAFSLMTEFIGAGVLRRNSGGRSSTCRRGGPVNRHAHPHPAGQICSRVHTHRTGDTKHVAAVPRRSARVFRIRRRRRSILLIGCRRRFFLMSDLDIGMNQRLGRAAQVGRQPPLRSRQGDGRRKSSMPGKDFGRYLDVDR